MTWYRTGFRLDLPRGQDVPVGLRFDGTGAYRVLIFVNGWQLGQFTADLGPQREFVLPAGVLHEHGENALALAVIALDDTTTGGPGPVSLVPLANQRGGVTVHDVPAPGHHGYRTRRTRVSSHTGSSASDT